MLAECKEHLHALVITALYTGFRRNELLSFRLEDIDFARGLVRIRQGMRRMAKGGQSL